MTSLRPSECQTIDAMDNKREDEGGGGDDGGEKESHEESSSTPSPSSTLSKALTLSQPTLTTNTTTKSETTTSTTSTTTKQTTTTTTTLTKSVTIQKRTLEEVKTTSANTNDVIKQHYNNNAVDKTNMHETNFGMLELFVEHVNQQQQRELDQQLLLRDRRLSLPVDSVELSTLNGVIMRRKQQLHQRYQQQMSHINHHHGKNTHHQTNNNNTGNISELSTKQQSTPQATMHSPAINRVTKVSIRDNRPLSISSISSATSSGSSSSSNSTASSGIHSSIASNGGITHRVVTEIIETERTYVDDLEQIVTGYLCYLRNVLKQHQKQQHHQQPYNTFERQPQQKHEHEHDQEQQRQNDLEEMVNDKMIIINNEEDDKSMFTFDDDITSATNDEGVDDCDVEEGDSDFVILSDRTSSLKLNSSNINLNNIKENDHTTTSSVNDAPETLNNTTCRLNHEHQATMDKIDNGFITANHIRGLFSNLEEIYKFNKDLLFRLEECYLNPGSVAECFVENAPGFQVYTHYCTTYPQVVSTLTELMSDQSAAQILKERQTKLNQGLPLGAYLLKPVQRILKYHILFQSLIKHTSDEDSVNEKDKHLINEAFNVMTDIACHINSMKKRHEHAVRVQEVQGLLCGWEGPDLTTLGELILEDTFKLYNRPKSSRHLFLFDNVLLITKKKRDGTLCYKDHIACTNLMLIEKIEGQPLVFNTVPFDNPKALCAFQAKNLDKMRDWCLRMKEVIIKSFEVEIPDHVKDILMSLTNNSGGDSAGKKDSQTAHHSPFSRSSYESGKAIKAPNYLEKKKFKQHQDKKKQ